MFMVSPALVEASPHPTMQQFGTTKSHTQMPTTCSIGDFNMGINVMRVRQDTKTVLVI
jgi:hypothetical protein